MATESFSAFTKQENGKTVPMWNTEEINEYVAAQVIQTIYIQFILMVNSNFSLKFISERYISFSWFRYDC